MESLQTERVFGTLETFRIEIPSWGFANTGTRFGKFIQAAVAEDSALTPNHRPSGAIDVDFDPQREFNFGAWARSARPTI